MKQKTPTPDHIQWLRLCAKDPTSPARLPGSLGMLTGRDYRALAAIAACWQLYSASDDYGARGALEAVRALLPGMQARPQPLAIVPVHRPRNQLAREGPALKAVYSQAFREYEACDPDGYRIKFARNEATAWEACRKHAKQNAMQRLS